MIITCEACNTSFNLDDKMIKPTGSKVRCSVCANIFTAFPKPEPVVEPEPEQASSAPDSKAVGDVAASVADGPPAEAVAEEATPETDVIEEQADDLFTDGTDLDFALDEEPEETVPAAEIEDAVSDALEEDRKDPSLESDPAAVGEGDATVIASLDDDDFNLDLTPEPGDEEGTATVIANLDDEDLDLSSLDGESDVAATVIADLDQENFDLEESTLGDGDLEGTATVIANLDDDTFDLDGDFSLEPEDVDAPEAVAPVLEEGPQSIDDLDDLNLTLDMESEDEGAQEETPAPEAEEASLDDLSIDLDMDEESAPDAEPAPETPVLADDLDLSSLENLLDEDAADEDDDASLADDDAEEMELSLDMDDVGPVTEAASGSDEALEDLEFDLDGDGPVQADEPDDADAENQEIDLSEIEKMLEEPEDAGTDFTSAPDQDLDLDIEASLETEKWMSESGEEDQLVMDEELDLSDLEQALEDVDMDASDEEPEDEDLELDLEEGEAPSTATETIAVDNELDFDLSDFEDTPPPESGDQAAVKEAVDMELEFEVEEDRRSEQTLEDEGLEETVAVPEPLAAKAATAPPEPFAAPEAAPKTKQAKPPKKGVSKSLVFLLVLVILGGGGYGTYYMLNQNGIEIPFLSDYLKPKVNDPGNLKLTTYDINSKFVDNASVGKLFVVSGKVKNGYSENRGMITLAGRIFSTGKVPANLERVYCGNIMSDLELANLEWDKIKSRLSNRLGDNRTNVKIEPGKSIPFMVVFSNLPEDLEEFTIEVTGSTSLK